eukprot:scaffold68_cov340-Pavlova_lutheri.AAC.43
MPRVLVHSTERHISAPVTCLCSPRPTPDPETVCPTRRFECADTPPGGRMDRTEAPSTFHPPMTFERRLFGCVLRWRSGPRGWKRTSPRTSTNRRPGGSFFSPVGDAPTMLTKGLSSGVLPRPREGAGGRGLD